MPVEIRELVIRVVTTDKNNQDEDNSSSSQSTDTNQEAIIQACVRQVLRILKKQEER